MTTGGWITMLVSVGFVTVLFGWCLYRVLFRLPPAEVAHLRSEANITPPDIEE